MVQNAARYDICIMDRRFWLNAADTVSRCTVRNPREAAMRSTSSSEICGHRGWVREQQRLVWLHYGEVLGLGQTSCNESTQL